MTVPSLSPDTRDLILSHLVPPALPLPSQVLARTFLERLSFLPPDPDDLDAHLTPFPPAPAPPSTAADPMAKDARNPNALHAALERLSGSLKISDTEYAHDGEMTIARTRLAPEFGDDGSVDTFFEHEDGDKGRGWVYRGASLGGYGTGDQWNWTNRVEDVQYNSGGYDDENAPDNYWAGFTPPNERVQLPGDENEEDYWAQYGAGVPEPEPEHEREVDTTNDARTDPEPLTPPTVTIPAPDPAATLSLLLQGLGADAAKAESHIEQPTSSRSAHPSALEQKVRAKVRQQLMRAWEEFSAEYDTESAAFEWLKLGREVADRPSWGVPVAAPAPTFGDVRAGVVRARVEAAKDVHDVLEADKDDFWRLCEESIRVHTSPVQADAEPEFEF